MNIAFCLNHFMPAKIAGTEVYTWALAKSLQERGHIVNIIVPHYNSVINDEYAYDGLSVNQYAEPTKIDKILVSGRRPPDGIKAFKNLIRRLRPDIVHVQELSGSCGIGFFHLKALKKMKVKVICTMHLAGYSCFCGTLMYKGIEHCDGKIDINKCTRCALSRLPVNEITQSILYNASIPLYKLKINTGNLNISAGTVFSYPFIIEKLRTTLLKIADLCEKIIVLTDWYKEVLLINQVPENKVHLIKQALPSAFLLRENRLKTSALPIRLVFVGRIDPLKGIHLLLNAISNIPENEIQLDIYGAINEEDYCRYWKDKTATTRNVKWRGTLPQNEVVRTIKEFDALVLPSTFSEMSPLVIQEAFAAGVPVIGSDVKGIAEQVKDGINGLLFKFGDSRSLEAVLKNIIVSPGYLNQLATKIKPPRAFDEVVKETLLVYDSITRNQQSTNNLVVLSK